MSQLDMIRRAFTTTRHGDMTTTKTLKCIVNERRLGFVDHEPVSTVFRAVAASVMGSSMESVITEAAEKWDFESKGDDTSTMYTTKRQDLLLITFHLQANNSDEDFVADMVHDVRATRYWYKMFRHPPDFIPFEEHVNTTLAAYTSLYEEFIDTATPENDANTNLLAPFLGLSQADRIAAVKSIEAWKQKGLQPFVFHALTVSNDYKVSKESMTHMEAAAALQAKFDWGKTAAALKEMATHESDMKGPLSDMVEFFYSFPSAYLRDVEKTCEFLESEEFTRFVRRAPRVFAAMFAFKDLKPENAFAYKHEMQAKKILVDEMIKQVVAYSEEFKKQVNTMAWGGYVPLGPELSAVQAFVDRLDAADRADLSKASPEAIIHMLTTNDEDGFILRFMDATQLDAVNNVEAMSDLLEYTMRIRVDSDKSIKAVFTNFSAAELEELDIDGDHVDWSAKLKLAFTRDVARRNAETTTDPNVADVPIVRFRTAESYARFLSNGFPDGGTGMGSVNDDPKAKVDWTKVGIDILPEIDTIGVLGGILRDACTRTIASLTAAAKAKSEAASLAAAAVRDAKEAAEAADPDDAEASATAVKVAEAASVEASAASAAATAHVAVMRKKLQAQLDKDLSKCVAARGALTMFDRAYNAWIVGKDAVHAQVVLKAALERAKYYVELDEKRYVAAVTKYRRKLRDDFFTDLVVHFEIRSDPMRRSTWVSRETFWRALILTPTGEFDLSSERNKSPFIVAVADAADFATQVRQAIVYCEAVGIMTRADRVAFDVDRLAWKLRDTFNKILRSRRVATNEGHVDLDAMWSRQVPVCDIVVVRPLPGKAAVAKTGERGKHFDVLEKDADISEITSRVAHWQARIDEIDDRREPPSVIAAKLALGYKRIKLTVPTPTPPAPPAVPSTARGSVHVGRDTSVVTTTADMSVHIVRDTSAVTPTFLESVVTPTSLESVVTPTSLEIVDIAVVVTTTASRCFTLGVNGDSGQIVVSPAVPRVGPDVQFVDAPPFYVLAQHDSEELLEELLERRITVEAAKATDRCEERKKRFKDTSVVPPSWQVLRTDCEAAVSRFHELLADADSVAPLNTLRDTAVDVAMARDAARKRGRKKKRDA